MNTSGVNFKAIQNPSTVNCTQLCMFPNTGSLSGYVKIVILKHLVLFINKWVRREWSRPIYRPMLRESHILNQFKMTGALYKMSILFIYYLLLPAGPRNLCQKENPSVRWDQSEMQCYKYDGTFSHWSWHIQNGCQDVGTLAWVASQWHNQTLLQLQDKRC